MERATNERPPRGRAERLSRLFKVLVLGGAVVAAAYATRLAGDTGAAAPVRGDDDGGTQGW